MYIFFPPPSVVASPSVLLDVIEEISPDHKNSLHFILLNVSNQGTACKYDSNCLHLANTLLAGYPSTRIE